jgi:hypothetical protein
MAGAADGDKSGLCPGHTKQHYRFFPHSYEKACDDHQNVRGSNGQQEMGSEFG